MKPNYTLPTMTDVAKRKGTNGYTMVSTFSGCGGACLGFEYAGFDLRYANEFIPEAQTTYRANHPDVHLDGRDIRTVTAQEILDTIGLAKGELDLFEGSPPCSPFSTAGKRDKGWGETKTYSDSKQRSDDLFFEYSRLLNDLQPKTFTAENVSGLVKGTAIGYFREILRELRNCGYQVEAQLLDASRLGVPQARQRLIFIGVRNDLAKQHGLKPVFPKPLPYTYTLEEVIDVNNQQTHDPETGQDITIDRYAIGNAWDRTPIGQNSTKYFNLGKPALNKPAPTITATAGVLGAASIVHPTQKRKLTLPELRQLSSFPTDFKLTGTYTQRVERIGRSVPPLLGYAIATTIRDEILAKIPNDLQ